MDQHEPLEANDANEPTPGIPPVPEELRAAAYPAASAALVRDEQVARGLLFALAAIVGGIVLTIVVWRIGFIASITSFAMAAGAVWLYQRGATEAPRKGLLPLVVLIVLGVVASFFGVIASEAWDAYGQLGVVGQSRLSFIGDNIFRGEVLKGYGDDGAMFALFAALGVFGTVRRLLAQPHA